jgi:hypothetical protein
LRYWLVTYVKNPTVISFGDKTTFIYNAPMDNKEKSQSNNTVWKITTAIAVVLLLCSLCFNAFFAFTTLNSTIRINELEGGGDDINFGTSSSSDRPTSAPRVTEMTEKENTIDESTAAYEIKGSYPTIYINGKEFEPLTTDLKNMIFARIAAIKKEERFPGAGKSTYTFDYVTHNNSEDYLGIVLSGHDYVSGAAHGNPFKATFNYQISTGKALTLPSMLGTQGMQKLADYVFEELKDDSKISDLQTLKSGSEAKPENYTAWYMSNADTINVYFSVYQIAAYAAGEFEVAVPKKELID